MPDATSSHDGGALPDAARDATVENIEDGSSGDADASSVGCTVVLRQSDGGVVLRGEVLATAGTLQGEVFVDSLGKLACVATTCTASPGYSNATILSCPRAVIAPGLVNAHVHLDYSSGPPAAHGTTRWQHRQGWRKGTNNEPILETPLRSSELATNVASELRQVLAGVTTVNGSGGVLGLARNLASTSDAAELTELGGTRVFFDTFPLGDADGIELTSGCAYPSVRSSSAAFADGGWYSPHIAEGINAAAQNEFSCLKGTLITSHTAIAHGVGINARDVATIRETGASVIWSPRSNIDLYGNTAPVTELSSAGVNLALGTDWLPTGSMNMLREFACVRSLGDKYFPNRFGAKAQVDMASGAAARALGWDAHLGSLTTGLVGDVAVFDATQAAGYDAVTSAGVEDVLLVLRGGKPLYGDAALVDALAPACEALGVCGVDKKVCIETPGITLADVVSAAAVSYPLFFCKGESPSAEPSCVPYRDSYPNGTSATDRDGDGVPDADDDCADVFNPVRPMDGTGQSDVDGDGVGDACDPAPLDNAQ